MRLLIVNDDGIHAPGLAALERAVAPLGEATTVAPQREHSAQSHAFTLHKPLRLSSVGERRYAVSGTPADCTYVGLHHVLRDTRPDWVVSGINKGANLGYDVHYSGTVAAAREAAFAGVKAAALSLYLHDRSPVRWDTAERAARLVLGEAFARGIPERTYLNVNIPNRSWDEVRGVRVVRMGQRLYNGHVDARQDPFGRPYFWIGGTHLSFDPNPETDGRACEEGWIVVTPMHVDVTEYALLDAMQKEWTFDAP